MALTTSHGIPSAPNSLLPPPPHGEMICYVYLFAVLFLEAVRFQVGQLYRRYPRMQFRRVVDQDGGQDHPSAAQGSWKKKSIMQMRDMKPQGPVKPAPYPSRLV